MSQSDCHFTVKLSSDHVSGGKVEGTLSDYHTVGMMQQVGAVSSAKQAQA